jgi:hypothetical protein
MVGRKENFVMPRYQKIGKGLYKDTSAGTYYAVKYVKSKKYSKTFTTPSLARKWIEAKKSHRIDVEIVYDAEDNGTKNYTFRELWDKYRKIHFPKLQESTIEVKLERSKFFDDLMDVKLRHFNPDFIDDYIIKKKEVIMQTMKKNRYNLDHELTELSAVLNFYQRNMDYKFVNPVVRERHWPMGVIQKLPERNKKLDQHELGQFFSAMWEINEQDGLFALLAENQFFMAARIGEASAVRLPKINFRSATLTIDESVSWHMSTKTFRAFKCTKTGETRYHHINSRLERNFRILISKLPAGCDVLHQIDGRPLHYYEIYHAYERGLRRAGLFPKYRATHIMRHSMAKQARIVTGTIDGAQAVGGWASIKQCEEYADSPTHLQIEAIEKVEKRLKLVN